MKYLNNHINLNLSDTKQIKKNSGNSIKINYGNPHRWNNYYFQYKDEHYLDLKSDICLFRSSLENLIFTKFILLWN